MMDEAYKGERINEWHERVVRPKIRGTKQDDEECTACNNSPYGCEACDPSNPKPECPSCKQPIIESVCYDRYSSEDLTAAEHTSFYEGAAAATERIVALLRYRGRPTSREDWVADIKAIERGELQGKEQTDD